MKYSDKFKDPRWQKKRLEIFQRDEFSCRMCGNSEETLHVHHLYYEKGKEPWEYNNECLMTLCQTCHEYETNDRAEAEKELLYILKSKGYFAFDLNYLSDAIRKIDFPLPASVCMAIICHAISQPDITEKYFEFLKNNQSQSTGEIINGAI